MLTALLFDLDGTLANTDSLHFQTWCEVLQDYGMVIDRPFYDAKFSGRRNQEILADLLPQLSNQEGQALSRDKEARFRQQANLTPLPGLLDLLDWMEDQPLQRAVVTNAPPENGMFMLRALGVAERFETVVFGETLPKGKPDPLPYQVGLNRLGVEAEGAIAFEDSPSGIRSAVGAGILTVGIASTHASADLVAAGASLVVDDFLAPSLWALLHQRLGVEAVAI